MWIKRMLGFTRDWSKVCSVPRRCVSWFSGERYVTLVLLWAKDYCWHSLQASDRYGRKPVLVISLLGLTVATVLFGLSRTLWQMALFRCLGGVFAGTIVTVRAMLSENSTKHTQARAFSFFAFASNMGIFVGPLIGTSLYNYSKLTVD